MKPRCFRMPASLAVAAALLAAIACRPASEGPATLDARHDACRFCRMTVSDMRFAAQIAAPGEEAVFFDDLGCLTHYLTGGDPLPEDAVIYVSDHAAKSWVRADTAVFTRVPGLDTPMGSGLVAHRDAAARDADPVTRQGKPVELSEIVPAGTARGSR